MKKFLHLLFAVVLLAACSKKDVAPALTPQNVTAADIAGKWITTADTSFSISGNQKTTTIQHLGNPRTYFVYHADGTGSLLNDSTQYATLTFKASSGKITQQFDATGSMVAKWDFTILAISSTTMVVRSYNDDTDYYDSTLTRQ